MNLGNTLDGLERKGVKISSDVLHRINEVLGQEPDSDTDPTEYINSTFPDIDSLSGLDAEISVIEQELKKTEIEVEDQLSQFCLSSDISAEKIDSTLTVVDCFMEKIKTLDEQARQSRSNVLEIIKDIQQLETAKRNLSNSISVLNQYQYFSRGITQLRDFFGVRDFYSISNVLPKLVAIEEIFNDYNAIPQINDLLKNFRLIKESVKEMLKQEFDQSCSLIFDDHLDVNPRIMNCITLMAGKMFDLQEEFLKIFAVRIFEEYKSEFISKPENEWLDKVDRRFVWFKHHLVSFDEVYNMWFPYSWEADCYLIKQFCEITCSNLDDVMTRRRQEVDYKLLLNTLQECIKFEDFLKARSEYYPAHLKIEGIVTGIFEKYMDIYIQFQDENLSELVEEYVLTMKKKGFLALLKSQSSNDSLSEDKIMNIADSPDDSNVSLVLPASGELFLCYKRCLIQFSKMRQKGCIGEVIRLFKKYLNEFNIKILDPALQRSTNLKASPGDSNIFDSTKTCAAVICTAAYCSDTTDQLELKIREMASNYIEGPELSFFLIRQGFENLINLGMNLLVQIVEQACEPGFISRSKVNWSNYHNVGDQSHYVSLLTNILKEYIQNIRSYFYLCEKYYDQFTIMFISSFLPKFVSEILSSKPITSHGIEQLLLDAQIFKKFLLFLPSIGLDTHKPHVQYSEFIKSNMKKMEIMLKLVITPHRPFDEFADKFISLVDNSSLEDFETILDMKGLKKQEKKVMLENYNMVKGLKKNPT